MNTWLLLALAGVADSALVVIVDGIASGEIAGIIIACIAGFCCLAALCLLCAHQNREGKHDKQAKPWEPSHSGPAPHSLDLVSTKEHGDDVPEAIR